jgi:dihydrolipoamide dehydrogenase
LALKEVPKKLLIIGAGVIGVELGSVFARLGSEVSFVEFLPKICPGLDDSLSKELLSCLQRQGMTFHLGAKVIAGSGTTLTLSTQEGQQRMLSADKVLVCIGRRPYTQGLGLDAAGVALDEKGFVKVDGQFRTAAPHIFAIGDLIDGPMLAHKASEEGMAVAEMIAGKSPKLDYASIPNVVYTHPEVASVGLTEQEATKAGLDFTCGTFSFKANSRARCAGEEDGFVKILATKQKGRLIGVHIIGAAASDLIAEAALAIRMRLCVADLIHTPHAHPTFAEAILEAALAFEQRAVHK